MSQRGRLGPAEVCISFFGFLLVVAGLFHQVTFGGRTVSSAPHIPFTLPKGSVKTEVSASVPLMDPYGPGWMHEAAFPYVKRTLSAGKLPLWHPHVACGNPYFAELLPGLVFPTGFLRFIGTAQVGFDLSYLANLILAGWFMYLFLRVLGLGIPGSFTAGVLYLGCGYMISEVNLINVRIEATMPGLLLALECLLTQRTKRHLLLAILMVFLVLVGGNPVTTFLVLALGAAYALARVLALPRSRWLRCAALYLAAHVAGAMLAAPQLLPFLEFVSHAAHNHPPFGDTSSMPWQTLIVWIVPGFFRRAYEGEILSRSGGMYGVVTMGWVLAITAFSDRNHRFLRGFCAAALGVVAAWYFGVPGFSWIGHLPAFNQVHVPRYVAGLLCFFAPVLAGIGLDNLLGIHARKAAAWLIAAGLLVGLVVALFTLFWRCGLLVSSALNDLRLDVTDPVVPALDVVSILGAGILLVSLALFLRPSIDKRVLWIPAVLGLAEVAYFMPSDYPERRNVFGPPAFLSEVKGDPRTFRIYSPDSVLHPNTAGIFGLNDIRYAATLKIRRYYRLIEQAFDYPAARVYFPCERRPGVPPRALTVLGVRYLFCVGDLLKSGAGDLPGGYRRDFTVIQTEEALDLTGSCEVRPGSAGTVSVWLNQPDTARIVSRAVLRPEEQSETIRLVPRDPSDGNMFYLGVQVAPGSFMHVESIRWCRQPLDPDVLRHVVHLPSSISRDGPVRIRAPAVIPLPPVPPGVQPALELRGRSSGQPASAALVIQKARRLQTIACPAPGKKADHRERFRIDLSEFAGNVVQLSVAGSRETTIAGLEVVPRVFVEKPGAGGVRIFEHVNPLPRAFGVHRIQVVPDEDEQLKTLLDPGFPVRTTVLLEAWPKGVVVPDAPPPRAPEIVWLQEDEGGSRIVLEARFAADGLLVLHDNAYPGWTVRVDEKPGRLLRANYCFRAVPVPRGVHRVEFRFSPVSLQVGLVVAATAILGLLVLLLPWRRFGSSVSVNRSATAASRDPESTDPPSAPG